MQPSDIYTLRLALFVTLLILSYCGILAQIFTMMQDEVETLLSHYMNFVRRKIQGALVWSNIHKNRDLISKTKDSREIAALVLFYEMAFEGSTLTGESLCQEASADSSDIAPWLRNNFHFPKDEVYSMLTTWMISGAKKLPFNPIELNSQYEIMQEASSRGDVGLIQWLVQNGVDIDTRDSDGRTALHVAAQQGHKELVRFFLVNRASIFRMDNSNQTPFYKAFDSGHFDTAVLLGPLFTQPQNFRMLLITAAGGGNAENVKYLLEYVSHRSRCSECFTFAEGKRDCATAKAMIMHCPWYQDDLGLVDNLLYLAAKEGLSVMAELLLSIGASIDQRTMEIAQEKILNIFEKYENSSDEFQIVEV